MVEIVLMAAAALGLLTYQVPNQLLQILVLVAAVVLVELMPPKLLLVLVAVRVDIFNR
jgi:hypothetical protein